MVFTTTNLFKGIACPEGEQCQLTSCIFSHELRPQAHSSDASASKAADATSEPATKRRKITADDNIGRVSKSDQIREQLAAARRAQPEAKADRPHGLTSLDKPVTPPPTNGKKQTEAAKKSNQQSQPDAPAATEQKENLNPRLIPSDPVGHAKRTLFLKHMHTEMARLNQKVADGQNSVKDWKLLHLSEQELIKMALDEEEALAKEHGNLYPNKIKQRFATYKKMSTDTWIDVVKTKVIGYRPSDPQKPDPDEKVIETGLSAEDEALILPFLVADQSSLVPHGYIPIPPTEGEAAEAQAGVDDARNTETCERCGSKFQVFHERNEEGLLTSNGPCKFHPNRVVFPAKTKNDFHGATKEPYHPCCNELRGTAGCTTHESHVFKLEAPSRLAAILPFITTPENPKPRRDRHGREVKAITFDCEMGYTTRGFELVRLTAVSWPYGEELLDILVRPVGTIIDLNSRFSGVFPEHFAAAIPYEEWESYVPPPLTTEDDGHPKTQTLPIVPSIPAARALLTSFLTPTTPLMGHAIDNDLNVTRLCHPTIIDTVLLFPHPRRLPFRHSLRNLTLQHLGRRIQTGGERGHDSAEDARATGDLVRVKVKEKWGVLKRSGVEVSEGQLGRRDGQGVWEAFDDGVGDAWVLGSNVQKPGIHGRGSGRKRKKSRGGGSMGMDGAADEDSDDSSAEEKDKSAAPVGNGIAAFLPPK